MSYGFNFRAATKADAVAALAPKFDEVVAAQPVHAADRDIAIGAATAFINTLAEPGDGEEVSVSVSGSLQWRVAVEAGAVPESFSGANVSVSASIFTTPAD